MGHVLAEEIATYERLKPRLLETDREKFALIKGGDLIGTFLSFEDAYAVGLRRFWPEPFLVRQVLEHEPVASFPALSTWVSGAGIHS